MYGFYNKKNKNILKNQSVESSCATPTYERSAHSWASIAPPRTAEHPSCCFGRMPTWVCRPQRSHSMVRSRSQKSDKTDSDCGFVCFHYPPRQSSTVLTEFRRWRRLIYLMKLPERVLELTRQQLPKTTEVQPKPNPFRFYVFHMDFRPPKPPTKNWAFESKTAENRRREWIAHKMHASWNWGKGLGAHSPS